MKLLICAGGTGGGIYPALAAATALQNNGLPTENILWIGTKGDMEETLVPKAGLQLETITGGAIAGVPLHTQIANGARLAWGVPKALGILRRFRPDIMFMTGGYMAAPVTVACQITGVPICIYLPDVEPGSAVSFSMRFAKKVGATTDGTAEYVSQDKLVVTGYPVRPELRAATKLTKEEALAQFDLKPGRLTLFVFGGSRGAQTINRALMAILPELLQEIQVIHISGTRTWPEVEANWQQMTDEQKQWYRPYAYLHEEMGPAFRAADLVVARGGASMLGESPAFGLPSILIPYPWAWRYQKVNADYLANRGAAIHLPDETIGETLLPTIRELVNDPEQLAQMGVAARKLDIPDAANNLAELIHETAKGTA